MSGVAALIFELAERPLVWLSWLLGVVIVSVATLGHYEVQPFSTKARDVWLPPKGSAVLTVGHASFVGGCFVAVIIIIGFAALFAGS